LLRRRSPEYLLSLDHIYSLVKEKEGTDPIGEEDIN